MDRFFKAYAFSGGPEALMKIRSMRIIQWLKKGMVEVLLSILWIYKKMISPWMGQGCRFGPTCSEYMSEAIQIHGSVKGLFLGVRRLGRCHPWGGSGFDPVPTSKEAHLHSRG